MVPVSSVARLDSKAGSPCQRQGRRKRVRHFESTGSCSAASVHAAPPSVLTSTLVTLPLPDQAIPEISWNPGSSSFCPPDGDVMTDLASMTKLNWRTAPSGMSQLYFDVSSRVCHGASPNFRRRSHFTLVLPS